MRPSFRIFSRLAACALSVAAFFCLGADFSQAAYLVSPTLIVNQGASATGGLSSLSGVSNANSLVSFRITAIVTNSGSPTTDTLSVNMPAGFEYVGSQSAGTCGYLLTSAGNGNFRYTFSYSGSGAPCSSRADFTYRITTSATAGTKTVSILNGSNQSVGNSVTVGVTAVNTISHAETIGNGSSPYVNSYFLTFTAPLSGLSDLDSLTVGGDPILSRSASGSTGAVVTFANSAYGTYDTPQIGGTFDGVTLDDTSVNELDRAVPYLTGAVAGTYYTGSVTLGFTEGIGLLNGNAFSSGSVVMIPGSYTLVVTDTSLNSSSVSFVIANGYETDAPAIGDQDVLDIARTSATLRFAFSDAHYTVGTATGSVTLGTGGSYTNAGSYTIAVQTGSVSNTGTVAFSSLTPGARYDYRITLTDNFANTSTATGSFYAASAPLALPTTESRTGAVSLTGSVVPIYSIFSLSGSIISSASDPLNTDSITGSLTISGIDSMIVEGGNWSGILYPPRLLAVSDPDAAVEADVRALINALNTRVTVGNTTTTTTYTGTLLQTVAAGAEDGVGLSASGGYFAVAFSVPSAASGSTLRVYRSNDGNTWMANSPTLTCIVNSAKLCSFTTNHLSYFALALVTSSSSSVTVPSSDSGNTGGGSSGGGGGGGGGGSSPSRTPDACSGADRSGSRYDGLCDAPSSDGSAENSLEYIQDRLSPETLDRPYFDSAEGAEAYLRFIGANEAIVKLNAKLLAPLADPYLPYYRTIDEVDDAYVRSINGAVLLLDRALAWKKSKSPADKAEAAAGYAAYREAIETVKDARAVAQDATLAAAAIRESDTWSVRLPKQEKLAKVLRSFSRKFAARDTKLLSTGSITLDEHARMLSGFEDFVLLVALYRESPSPAIKSAAKEAFARAYAVYRTSVRASAVLPLVPASTPVTPLPETPAESAAPAAVPVALGSVYALPDSAAYGQTSEGIRTLQFVLRAYGYFPADVEPTGYYGPTTRDSLAKFSSGALGIDNPQGLYTSTVRDAMRALPYDPSKFTN